MNILVVTKAVWDDRLASGNTLSNFFEGWENVNFSCLYSREAMPCNKVCRLYYSISPVSIIKNFFRPSRIGKRFEYCSAESEMKGCERENNLINTAKHNRVIFEPVYYFLYSTNLWINKAFKQYIDDFNPDIVFCFGQCDPLTFKAVKYIKQHTAARVISYFVDDLYQSDISTFNFIEKLKRGYLKGIARMSDRCYAISQRMCDEYSELYGKSFSLLHKGCDICETKPTVNNPVKFVYAGNLFYHRDKILGALAASIARINDGFRKAHLDIYSGTTASGDMLAMLNVQGASTLHKACSFGDIKKIMMDADVVLHVESFDEEQMELVRLSFSTKITDCMQSGSMMMAIGPKSVASIDFAAHVPGCVVVNDLNDLDDTVKMIVDNGYIIIENAKKTNAFAMECFELNNLRRRLYSEFKSLI